jgi:sugar phosphate isomerase/epimerase
MTSMNRRNFLALTAAAAIPAQAKALKSVGVQLYTLRSIMPQSPLETIKAVEKIGYKEVEVVGSTLDVIWSSLKQTSLKPVSIHIDNALFLKDKAKLPAALEDAAKRGFKFAVCPYVPPAERGGADVMKRLGDNLNEAGEQCKKLKLSLCYHNHAFEFAPSGTGTLFDVLMQSAQPNLVGLELDVMWAAVAGVDPVSILQKLGSRVQLLHLKDLDKTAVQRFAEGVPAPWFKELGKGTINFPAVLKAAKKAKVQHYFVEQDQTPGNPLDSLRESFQYLDKL